MLKKVKILNIILEDIPCKIIFKNLDKYLDENSINLYYFI